MEEGTKVFIPYRNIPLIPKEQDRFFSLFSHMDGAVVS